MVIDVKKFTNCKFLHVIGMNELKYSIPLVELINNNPQHFNAKEHAFVTAHRDVYKKLEHYDNVFLFEENFESEMGTCFSVPIINKCGANAKWIIVHDQWFLKSLIRIKPWIRKKIIWRTWGGALFYNYKPTKTILDIFKNTIKVILNGLPPKIIKRFFAIGTANIVDEIELKKIVGNVKTYPMSYCTKDMYKIVEKEYERGKEKSKCVNILVGHSGFAQDNHIENIERLSDYSKQNIKVYFSFAYGEREYMECVKTKAKEVFGEKAVFIEEFLPFEEYVAFLNRMDVAILDALHSTALYNLAILMQLKKKIYINRNGLYYEAMQTEGIPCYYSDEIQSTTFDKFASENVAASMYGNSDLLFKDYETDLKNWEKIFEDLNLILLQNKNK